MLTTIHPSALHGTILAPASKSSMQRACAAALLRVGETTIHHPGHSNDDKAALGVIRDLGAIVTAYPHGELQIESKGVRPAGDHKARSESGRAIPGTGGLEVNCGESGLGLRMFAPIIGLSDRVIKVRGEGSLLTRPMDFFDEIFPLIGIRVVSNGGKLPLEIQGPLQPRNITIDGSLSSQFLTGLLLSYAAAGAADVSIRVENLKSRPYIDLTLAVMEHFGWTIENRNYEEFYFPAVKGRSAERIEYTVEGDWSGGAFLLVAGAVSGPIRVKGLDTLSTQADKAILQAIRDSGALLEEGAENILVGPAGGRAFPGLATGDVRGADAKLQAFRFDATHCPDLFPPLVALATYCEGVTEIGGVSRLAHKESDRGLTLQDEFGKMGVKIDLDGDLMRVYGGGTVRSATVHSRHDHRIAMACAVAGLRAEGAVTIEEAEAINKSYPDFYEHLKQLGANI